MDDNRSINAGQWIGTKHRKFDVQKVENGYVVGARFSEQRPGKDPFGDDEARVHWREVSKQFCFYTIEEVLDFAKNYMEAPSEALRSGGEA